MNGVLIAPGSRRPVGHLTDTAPLITLPILGESLVGYWLEHLSSRGFKEITLLVVDRPEVVRELVGDGARWGLRLTIVPELREPTIEETQKKYPDLEVFVLDHLPGTEPNTLFTSYNALLKQALLWMPEAGRGHRIGLREKSPGVWVGLRAQIAPSAILQGPCWIGENARIGPEAVVGPNAIVESQVVLESACEVQDSWVGPETFVGTLTRVKDSFAWGNQLINTRTNSSTLIPDAFLLSSLSQKSNSPAFSERLGTIFQSSISRPLGLLSALTQRTRR
jgi:NDP-sugar pyrophosphorylase family protein